MSKLSGKTVLVPESRELDLFCTMLETQGATAIRCPLVAIFDVEDATAVNAWLAELNSGAFDDLILLTGEGLARLLAQAERLGDKDKAIAAIGRLRTIVRGPKPARVLREIGLRPGLTAAAPTSRGVIDSLRDKDIKGRVIGVQLYPGAPPELEKFLQSAGARAVPVVPYRYASETEKSAVEDVIKELISGKFDVIAFTSTPQVERLFSVAEGAGNTQALVNALGHMRVAAVGPIVAAGLEKRGVHNLIQPASFHLKPLIAALVAAME